ncbi:MAG: hypothetical protein EOO85_28360 [Pedobacter sp.]|nr:MAG: hypothetical protein EOO85_28360 [Pedobacter sp.]
MNTQKSTYTRLKELTPEEWLDMGNGVYTLSGLNTTFMIKGLLGGAPVPYYAYLINKYKNLKKAVAIRNKEIDKAIKEKHRLERQKENN